MVVATFDHAVRIFGKRTGMSDFNEFQDWPQARDCLFAPDGTLLADAWRYSVRRFQQLRDSLTHTPLPADIHCLAVSGSLNRMEAHDKSDLDLLIVVDDRRSNVNAEDVFRDVWRRLTQAPFDPPLVRPKPGGVFAECASLRRMTDRNMRGVVDEPLTVFGQRMQFLLDAQPLVHAEAFRETQAEILEWYQEERIANSFGEFNAFHWLWQDVQRYWRSIRSRACWLHAEDPARSLEVNLKLRSSRLVLIVAFLRAVEAAGTGAADKVQAALQNSLLRTPMERLVFAADSPVDLLSGYEHLWNRCRHISSEQATVTATDRLAIEKIRHSLASQSDMLLSDWRF